MKSKNYTSNALILVVSTLLVKVITVVYKIPLTSLIGATGRGYFAIAYNLFIPFNSVCMGAVPVVVSKLVSEYLAKKNIARVSVIKSVSFKIMLVLGFVSTIVVCLIAFPYCKYTGGGTGALMCVLVLAPSLIFSCLSGARRGVFEGEMNMTPTAVSQLVDCLFKAVFGVLFARLGMSILFDEYLNFSTVLGKIAVSKEEALSYIYPITSALSMIGVLVGSFASFVYLEILMKKSSFEKIKSIKLKISVRKEIVNLSLPIITATAVSGISNIVEQASVNFCLKNANNIFLTQMYENAINFSQTKASDIPTYLFGIYSSVLDFKNLVPMVSAALGVAAVPVISSELAVNDLKKGSYYMEMLLKFSSVIGLGIGWCFYLMPKEIINIVYGIKNPDIAMGGERVLAFFGISMTVYALLSPFVCALQGAGLGKEAVLPFAFSAVIKVFFNALLMQKTDLAMVSFAVSSFLGTTVTLVWCAVVFFKKTKLKVRFTATFLRPVIVSMSIPLTIYFLKSINFSNSENINNMIILLITAFLYIVFVFLFRVLDFGSLKMIKKF